MSEELSKIALAGLLHDIGKFGQRAGELTAEGKDHAAVGEKFVRQYVPAPWRDALAPVGWHHGVPEGLGDGLFPVKVVMAADRLSAGEREHREEEMPRLSQMVSPFSQLAGHAQKAWLPLAHLELRGENLFPDPSPWNQTRLDHAYQALWEQFCQEAARLKQLHEKVPHLDNYLLTMLDLLLRYTWCMPSAFYYDVPDVSLYDHARTTAALSVCLWVAFKDREAELARLLEGLRDRPPLDWPAEPVVAALVEGDLSGIQDFLYSLRHPKGAAAMLRARSFYLQVLTEAVARWILRRLDLPPTNLLYCGGGRFRLLVPPQALAQLEALGVEVNRALLQAHRGLLYLALDGVPLTPAHFAPAQVRLENGLWQGAHGLRAAEDELAKKLARQKDRRFLELPQADLAKLFQPYGAENREICQICGESAPVEEDEEGLRWCPDCASFRELGRSLRNAEFLRFLWVDPRPLPSRPVWSDVLAFLGVQVQVTQDLPPSLSPTQTALLYRLTDAFPRHVELPRGANEAVARKFLVNVVATWRADEPAPAEEKEYKPKPHEVKNFGVLARQSRGAPYLGVLRMDMDNLGWLLRDGFVVTRDGLHLDRGTFSRKHSLSTLLSVFFEGFVGELVQDLAQREGVERVYAVYSGGDDLFLVGAWDAVLTLAQEIRLNFSSFTGRRDLGISAGLLLVHEKYPLYLAAQEAGERLEEAKRVRTVRNRIPPEKDCLWLLGRAISWEEFPTVRDWKERLVAAVAGEEAARRTLFVLQEVWEEYRREVDKRGPYGPWIWRTAYWLARQREMAKRAGRPTSLFEELQQRLSGEAFAPYIERLSLAARWAELETRGGGK